MMHSVIIDDESSGVISLQLLITKFVADVKVVASTTSAREGVELVNNYRPDIVFLDINMPGMNGFELLDRLDYRNFHLVFTTAHHEFGIRALRQHARDYLLKPIDETELNACIDRLKKSDVENERRLALQRMLAELKESRDLRIPLNGRDGIEYVRPAEIVCVEASSNQSVVTLVNGIRVKVNTALKQFESILCYDVLPFMRIHNSYVINTNHITRYLRENCGYVVVNGKQTVPVSRKHKDELLALLGLPVER